MKETIFFDIDTQKDFIYKDGSLPIPGAEKIRENLMKLTNAANKKMILIISTMDAHSPEDDEMKDYPLHCIAGSEGQQKISETFTNNAFTLKNTEVSHDYLQIVKEHNQVIIEKQDVNCFSNRHLEKLLTVMDVGVCYVYGVVTEICVKKAVFGLLELGHEVVIVEDAIKELDQADAKSFLDEAKDKGAKFMYTDDVIASL